MEIRLACRRGDRLASSTGPTTRRFWWSGSIPSCSSASNSRPRSATTASGGAVTESQRLGAVSHRQRLQLVKILLNMSKEQQRIRFLRRLDLPDHNWNFSGADVRERRYWADYQKAFSEMLSATSTEWAPWFVIPADRKWFARISVSAVLAHTLIELDPRYPEVNADQKRDLQDAKASLEAEAPAGAAAAPFRTKKGGTKRRAKVTVLGGSKPSRTRRRPAGRRRL